MNYLRITPLAVALLAFAPEAEAVTYNIDASIGATIVGCGPLPSCFPIRRSQAYEVEAGDTVNFGTMTVFPSFFQTVFGGSFVTGSFDVGFNRADTWYGTPSLLGFCNTGFGTCTALEQFWSDPIHRHVYQLVYEIPEGVHTIQLAWFFTNYAPPITTPLPGALLLFGSVLGLGGLLRRFRHE